jgi:hypothetical protein
MAPLTCICRLCKSKTTYDKLQGTCDCIGVRLCLSSVVVDSDKSRTSGELVALGDEDVAMGFSVEIASVGIWCSEMKKNVGSSLKMCSPCSNDVILPAPPVLIKLNSSRMKIGQVVGMMKIPCAQS